MDSSTSSDEYDYEFIAKIEGVRNTGYISTRDGELYGESGITIGVGLDLAYQDENSLKKIGIPQKIIDQWKPYLQKKYKDHNELKDQAQNVKIPIEYMTLICQGSVRYYWNNMKASFKNSDDLTSLSKGTKTALLSKWKFTTRTS